MTPQLRPERVTQNRVIQRFTAPVSAGGLGYRALGDWHQRENNRCIETTLLRENLTARYVPPYRLRNDINKLDAYDWIDRFDDLVKKMLLLEKDKDAFRSLSSIKAQAQNIDVSKYPVETEFVPVEEPVVRAQGQEEDDASDAEAGEVVISETDGTFGIAASPGINVVLEEASAEVVTAPEQPDDHAGLTQNPD